MGSVKLFSNIIIVNDESQVLLLRRSNTAPHRVFDWEFPGGYIESCEDPKVAAIRELSEETELEVSDARYIYAGTTADMSYTGFFFMANIDNPKVKLNYEHDEYKWLNPEEAINIVSVKAYKLALLIMQNNKNRQVIVSTKALVVNDHNTLALKRSAGDIGGGNWDLPGGRLEPGEDLYGSIKREVYEETSLVIVRSEIKYAHTEIVNDEIRIRVGQVAAVKKDDVRLSEEHDEYRWLDSDLYDFMNHPNWPGWGEFVKKYS